MRINSTASAGAAHNPKPKNSASQEEDASQEAESNVRFVLVTGSLASDTMPVPDASTTHTINVVCEQAKGYHPEDEEDKIHRPFCEGSSEWEEEEEGEEDAD